MIGLDTLSVQQGWNQRNLMNVTIEIILKLDSHKWK
jgi:hypothetical protein